MTFIGTDSIRASQRVIDVEMINSVKAALERYNMIEGVKEITVALSGGADSVALLLALYELKEEFGFSLSAAHLNHMLRGDEADADEAFAGALCANLRVPFTSEKIDVSKKADETGDSFELAARKIRYDFLQRVSSGAIATAHTASDNIETVLYNMTRGAGLDGICGIPPKRGRIIRPLIFATRAEVEAFLKERGVSFRTDSTNNDDVYTRNRLRHHVVPVLEGVNTAAVKNVSAMCSGLKNDADYLNKEAEVALKAVSQKHGLLAEKLKSLHPAISSRVISMYFEREIGITLERKHILSVMEMLGNGLCRQSIKGDYCAVVRKGIFSVEKTKFNGGTLFAQPREFPFEINNIKLEVLSAEEFKNRSNINNLLLKFAIDYDKICGELVLRNRLDGDKIRLCGRNVTKSFKKLFNENAISEQKRKNLPVLADDCGVLWLGDFGADERAIVTESTRTVLFVNMEG